MLDDEQYIVSKTVCVRVHKRPRQEEQMLFLVDFVLRCFMYEQVEPFLVKRPSPSLSYNAVFTTQATMVWLVHHDRHISREERAGPRLWTIYD